MVEPRRRRGHGRIDGSGDPANANREVAPRSDILGNSEREIADATVKLDWRTDPGTLTSITGYTDLTEDYFGDLDFCNPVDCPEGIFGLGSAGGPAPASSTSSC